MATEGSPIVIGARTSTLSSAPGSARAEITDAEMASSVRMEPKFFMMIIEKVSSVKLVEVDK
jgi:hypothetical protein